MGKKIIISVINDLVTDQRVKKVCSTLQEMGFELLLVGRKLPESLPLERPYEVKRMKLIFKRGPFFYAEFNFRLFILLLFTKADCLHSNDLDTLLPNFLVSRIKGIPLVYDSHEYFTEVPEIQNKPIVKKIWSGLEEWIFPKLKTVITVNESIAQLFEKKYGKKPLVIRNLPELMNSTTTLTLEEIGLNPDLDWVVIQGAGLNIDRGAEEAVLAMQYLSNIGLMVIGGGDVLPHLHRLVDQYHLREKVVFIPKMEYSRLLQYTGLAKIGLSLDKDTNINYRYSLPNKIFDYILSGVPILATDLIEIRRVVYGFEVGELLPHLSPQLLADRIRTMIENQNKWNEYRNNTSRAKQKLCWEQEGKLILKQVYSNLKF
ncbi:MAG: glycosyltransferase [Bacteroidia bacterium]|nr:glycosyltransferase [Bacteroidia bacterium]